MLGMPRDEYMKKILDKDTWGGAIELAIFSDQCVARLTDSLVADKLQLQDGDRIIRCGDGEKRQVRRRQLREQGHPRLLGYP